MPDTNCCRKERSQRNDRPAMSSRSGSTTPWRIHQCRGKVRTLTHDLQRVNHLRGVSIQWLGLRKAPRLRSSLGWRKRPTSPSPIPLNSVSGALIPNPGSAGEFNRCQCSPACRGGCLWIRAGSSKGVLEEVARDGLQGSGCQADQGIVLARVRYNPVSLVGSTDEVRRSLQSLRLVVRATAAAGTITRRSRSSGHS